jgi:enoyl-CoA hydratase
MADILCERAGASGRATLNRPAALNAINHAMVGDLAAALDAWEADPAVTRIVLTGAGGRAFSAGGDIRMLYEAARAGRYDEALAFWADEYRLNIRIKRYAKPYISLIDGICMGGGVGLSLHGGYRVAGDRYRFAMPEVGIGFFPDVGATFALPRLPGETGLYLALTGERVGPDDAAALGLATHLVPSAEFARLATRLEAGEDPEAVLAAMARPAGHGPIAAARDVIDRCFAAASVPAVLERLDAEPGEFAAAAAAAIRLKSPMSLAITYAQMRRGRDLDFEAAMALDYRIVSRIVRGHDFVEGVRATIVHKDGKPTWSPADLAEVDEAAVAAHFADLGSHELVLP